MNQRYKRRWHEHPVALAALSWDSAISVGVGLGTYFGSRADARLLGQGTTLLVASIALGAALLAVCLTALSILVAFFNDGDYLVLLRESPIGLEGSMSPYKQVAAVAGASVVTGLCGILAWNVAPSWGKGVALAVNMGLAVWAIVGTIQLVRITVFLGRLKARLPEIREAGRQALRDRNKSA